MTTNSVRKMKNISEVGNADRCRFFTLKAEKGGRWAEEAEEAEGAEEADRCRVFTLKTEKGQGEKADFSGVLIVSTHL
jgi:hypothetical protein